MPEGAFEHVRRALAQYDLGRVQAVERKSGGGIDENFLVIAEGGRFFFKRRSTDYVRGTVAFDHALIAFLVGHGFPTPPLVTTRGGSTWVEWEGRIYEGYQFVEGGGFIRGDQRQMSSLGESVGRYHRLVVCFEPPSRKLPPWGHSSLVRFLDLSGYAEPRLESLLNGGRIGRAEEAFVREATAQLTSRAERMQDVRNLVPLTVHGALEPGNVLFDEEGTVAAWTDWADSAQFVRVFDVAYALLKFAGRRPDASLPGQVGPRLDWRSVEGFAEAYRQEIQLTAAETAALPWVMLTCRLVDALWIDERHPMDHRRELGLAQELYSWLRAQASALQEVFG